MSGHEVAAVRCRAPFPVRRAFYATLARAVAGARRPAGVVLEATATDRVPWMLVRPARLLDDVLLDAGDRYGPLSVRPPPESPRPPPRVRERTGVVVPVRPTPSASEPLPPVPPSLPSLLGPDGWLAVQTFWIGGPEEGLYTARRFRFAAPDRAAVDARYDRIAAAVAFDWTTATGRPATTVRAGWGAAAGWTRRSVRRIPPVAWYRATPEALAGSAETRWLAPDIAGVPPTGHTVVFGSSGAGKTTYLADRAAEAIARGDPVVAIDLHGDLVPAVCARIPSGCVDRVVAVDAERLPTPGIAALVGVGADDRAAALLVATVKRLSADGTDVYWGFRLERIFDTFVRLVQETGGSLLDLYDLLTREERRDAARLATRRPELARFLDELEPVVRRTPDFLWPAASRLSKVALVPSLGALLAPRDGGLPLEALVAQGRSVLVRLPFGRIGPEAAALAGTFVLARAFLGLAGADSRPGGGRPVLLVLDEVHGFSPRLVAEVLAESRKFGVRVAVATQYPDRLAPEVRSAAAGAATRFVAFRVPPPTAGEAGAWLGFDPDVAARLLPTLPAGHGVELDTDDGGWRSVAPAGAMPLPGSERWERVVRRTREEFAPCAGVGTSPGPEDPALERLLLAVLSADERGAPLAEGDVVRAALDLPGPPLDGAVVADRWRASRDRDWVERTSEGCRLTPAGERWLGLTAPTHATRETAEHRRLLMRTFRIFARQGHRLEILRQGRFDTTLPDARFRQLPAGPLAPLDLAESIDRARGGWAWRYFGGRDVHVEAEVSGALRPERVRRGWAKAAASGAFVLFVVGDADRARRVRAALDRAGVPRERRGVWTLPATNVAKS